MIESGRAGNPPISGPPVTSGWQSVTIVKVANGFNLHIGCKIFIAKTWAEAAAGLGEYWTDPQTAERKYSTL